MLSVSKTVFPGKRCSIRAIRLVQQVVIGALLLLLAVEAVAANPLAAYKDRYYQLQAVDGLPQAPAFSLATLEGEIHQLDGYRGQVVVINFWSTWCAPCRKEMPSLERAWQQLKSENIRVLGVAIQDDPEMIARFLKEYQISFPILMDSDGQVAQSWPFSGIPATFVLDGEGRIVYRALGLREWDHDTILQKVRALVPSKENTPAAVPQ
ncbi:MAG: TlpA family protein disulfide reductase [Sedimenticola thiotaurini]|uniref:TlpA family protein disulfide reductase n=1 Tax=Sedimenticola thiotaurini TaxID=1543721 RepID=A0A558CMP5_9GAMM|nr:MAG: TlpA family protein disulfide reductase [Sedimenticola thiotaurini]